MVEIKTEVENGIEFILVKGEIDASSSIELDNALKESADKSEAICINLEGLDYISSAGLGVFISYIDDLKAKEVKLVLYGMQPTVKEVFQILGLENVMNIVATKKEAIALLA